MARMGGETPPLQKRPMQQRLKQMLRLPFRFPLLRAQTLKLLYNHSYLITIREF